MRFIFCRVLRCLPSAASGDQRKNRGGVLIISEGRKEGKNMKVVYMSPGELTPYSENAKVHTPEQVRQIANSIQRFGFQQPIVVDRNKVVIIGHGRLAAAKELNLDDVPVVFADQLSEEDVKALRLADNKLNESPWDFSLLEQELAELDIAGIDMTQFGFEDLSASGGGKS